jgi:hypothetical protein
MISPLLQRVVGPVRIAQPLNRQACAAALFIYLSVVMFCAYIVLQ